MKRKVCVIGIGYTDLNSVTPDLEWKELMYEACQKAYMDAGINPRKDVDSFITCGEDYWEGFSIFDEFVPDQIGAVLRPCCTVCGDGLYGLGNAYMQIKTGLLDVVSVEAHSKISDLLTPGEIMLHAMDPIFERPVTGPVERPRYGGSPTYTKEEPKPLVGRSDERQRVHPYFLAGLEMQHYLRSTGTSEDDCAEVVVRNKRAAFDNPLAAYEANLRTEDVMSSPYLFKPLKSLEISPNVDGAMCFVLAEEAKARELGIEPIYLSGFGWNSDTPWLSTRKMDAGYAARASKMAFKMAGLNKPREQLDIVEVDDRFSFKQFQHMEAMGLVRPGEAAMLMKEGQLGRDGELPTNLSGGSLGMGNLYEATGLQKALEVMLQLRGHAGKRQVADAKIGLAQSWRGIPSGSGAVAIFQRGG